MRLWELPGTRRFLDAVGRSLRDGVNVVLRFPGSAPPGLPDIVMRESEQFLTVSRLTGTRSPVRALYERYVPNGPVWGANLRNLCDSDGFRGRLIWLDDLTQEVWPTWKQFLTEYAQASRGVPTLGRTIFVVPLEGEPPQDPPDADVTMAVHDWIDVLDEIDLLLLANNRLPERRMDRQQRLLLATAVAHVASWDFDTAERLIDEEAAHHFGTL